MDQEFYFEESNPRKTKLVILILLLVFILIIGMFFFVRSRYTLNLKKNLKFEVGTLLSTDVRDFLNNKVVDEEDYTLMLSGVHLEDGVLNRVGDYTYKVKYKSVVKVGHIKVVDTVAPNVEVGELIVGVDEEFEPDDFIMTCEDYSKPCKVEYANEADAGPYNEEGKYNFKIKVSDAVGNTVEKEVSLVVKKGFNLTAQKESDLKIDHISPEFFDWNKQILIKFDKGYDPNSIDETEAYSKLMEVTGNDLHNYLPEIYANNLIKDSQLIDVYNKYGLIIGYAIRVELDNGLNLYCQNY